MQFPFLPELLFSLAHELRHAYQVANGESLEEYRDSNQSPAISDHMEQIHQ